MYQGSSFHCYVDWPWAYQLIYICSKKESSVQGGRGSIVSNSKSREDKAVKKIVSLAVIAMVCFCAFAQNVEAKKRPPQIDLQDGQIVLVLPAITKGGQDFLEPQNFSGQKKPVLGKGVAFFRDETCGQNFKECSKSAGVKRLRARSGRYLRSVIGLTRSEDAGTLNFRVSRRTLQLNLRKAVITASPGISWSVQGNTLSFRGVLPTPPPTPPPFPPPPPPPPLSGYLDISVVGDDEVDEDGQMTILPPVADGMLVNVFEEDEAGDGRPTSVPLDTVFALVWNAAEVGWMDEEPSGGVRVDFNASSMSLTVPLHDDGGMIYFLVRTDDGGTKILWPNPQFIVRHGGVTIDSWGFLSY